jgi:hypothetical protein
MALRRHPDPGRVLETDGDEVLPEIGDTRRERLLE